MIFYCTKHGVLTVIRSYLCYSKAKVEVNREGQGLGEERGLDKDQREGSKEIESLLEKIVTGSTQNQ